MAKLYIGYNNQAVKIWESETPTPTSSWENGTDAEIVAMVAAADRGEIDLTDYWNVGDKRIVHLSAMSATDVGESHVEQDIVLVLCDANNQNYEYVTPTSGRTYCNFIVQQESILAANGSDNSELGYINSSNTSSGSWNGCTRRMWCNNTYYNAIPVTLRPIFKQVNVKTINAYNGSTIQISQDYIFLPAEREIFDSKKYSRQTEWDNLTQWDYYKTAENRIKHKNNQSGLANNWWERSPAYNYSNVFCYVSNSGTFSYDFVMSNLGLAPAGCI